jgi:hypothetical protein
MSTSPWLAPLRPIGRFGETLLDRVLCVLGAVGLSQAPEFFQQYLQRLGGHLDEARLSLAPYEALARQSGITLQRLIEVNRAQVETLVVKQGDIIAALIERVAKLESAERALREASVWEKPFVFLSNVDPSIAARTWEVFKPAVPVTPEGFVYAAAGMLLALALYQVAIAWPGRILIRRWKKPAPAKG